MVTRTGPEREKMHLLVDKLWKCEAVKGHIEPKRWTDVCFELRNLIGSSMDMEVFVKEMVDATTFEEVSSPWGDAYAWACDLAATTQMLRDCFRIMIDDDDKGAKWPDIRDY